MFYKRYLTIKEAAERAGVTPEVMQGMALRGEVDPVWHRGRLQVLRSSFTRKLEESRP